MIYPSTLFSSAAFNLIRTNAVTRHVVVHFRAMDMLAHCGGAS